MRKNGHFKTVVLEADGRFVLKGAISTPLMAWEGKYLLPGAQHVPWGFLEAGWGVGGRPDGGGWGGACPERVSGSGVDPVQQGTPQSPGGSVRRFSEQQWAGGEISVYGQGTKSPDWAPKQSSGRLSHCHQENIGQKGQQKDQG